MLRRFPASDFYEAYAQLGMVKARREPNNLYAKVYSGEITGFTIVDESSEELHNPEVTIKTEGQEASARKAG
jgi:adenylylsulfate kinase-like enzyme